MTQRDQEARYGEPLAQKEACSANAEANDEELDEATTIAVCTANATSPQELEIRNSQETELIVIKQQDQTTSINLEEPAEISALEIK